MKLLPLSLLLALPTMAQAQFIYTTEAPPNYGTVSITGYTGTVATVTIPGSIAGLPVNSIDADAFQGNRTITNIVIPASVTNIYTPITPGCTALISFNVTLNNAFFSSPGGVLYDESQKTVIAWPDGMSGNYSVSNTVTTIGSFACYECAGMTNITFPSGLTNIGYFAFDSCSHLSGLLFNGNAPTLGQSAFSGDTATVYYVAGTTGWSSPFGGLSTSLWSPEVPCAYAVNSGAITITRYLGSGGVVNIPGEISGVPVTTIGGPPGNGAFYNATSVTGVILPTNLTTLGYAAFDGSGLTSIALTNGVTRLLNWAFEFCPNLTNAMIGSTVTNIGAYALASCPMLEAITVDPANPVYSSAAGVLYDAGQDTLIQCPGGKSGSCDIPATVTNILSTALAPCPDLTAINVDPANEFYSSVDGVLLAQNGTLLLQYPQGKAGNYIVPGSVTTIGGYAFNGSPNLTSITIGDNVTDLSGGYAFQGCQGLTNAVIGNGVTSIGGFSFNGCNKLISVTLGTNVTSIGEAAFQGCGSLTSMTLPDSVTSIVDWAFNQCYSLTRIIIGGGVTNLGTYAFLSCPDLNGLYFTGNAPPSLGSGIFNGDHATAYYLSGSTGWIAFAASTGIPTTLWLPQIQAAGPGFGVQSNQFGFNINWASGRTVVVEACTSLSNPVWQPLQTNMLSGGSMYFSDPQWSNYSSRFYIISGQ